MQIQSVFLPSFLQMDFKPGQENAFFIPERDDVA
jgi:hypothetical protein